MPEQISGQNPARNPECQLTPPPPTEPTLEQRVMALEAAHDSYQNEKNRNDLTAAVRTGERWLIVVNGLALLASIGIGVIYIFQLGEMKKATQAATKSVDIAASALRQNEGQFEKTLIEMKSQTRAEESAANVARRSADIANETLHVSERAYVFPKTPQLDTGTSTLFLPIENIGHIPATKVHVIVHVQKTSKLPNGSYYSFVRWFQRDFIEIWPGEPLSVGGVTIDQERTKRGEDAFTFGITVEYNDGFPDSKRQKREDAFCMSHLENNHIGYGPCVVSNTLDLLRRADQYPSGKNETP